MVDSYMASDAPHRIDYKKLVDPGYAQMLKDATEEAGLTQAEIIRDGDVGRNTVWRVLNGAELSIKGVVTVYNAILALRPELAAKIPPPLMPVYSRQEYRYMRIGQMLREADPDRFAELVDYMSLQLDRVTVRQARREIRERFGDIPGVDLSEGDGYEGD